MVFEIVTIKLTPAAREATNLLTRADAANGSILKRIFGDAEGSVQHIRDYAAHLQARAAVIIEATSYEDLVTPHLRQQKDPARAMEDFAKDVLDVETALLTVYR
jgi:hypothetical protein